MQTYYVTDFQKIDTKRSTHEAGYLLLPDSRIARSGIVRYSGVRGQDKELIKDGELISVYRPKEAIEQALKLFENLPLTLRHPDDDAVTPENAKKFTVGSLGSKIKLEEDKETGEYYVVGDIIVYDKDAIEKVKDGSFVETSAGYSTAFRKKEGNFKNEPYFAEQFWLSPNHVALVEKGRCGESCKVCDSVETTKGVEEMRVNKNDKIFLIVGDSSEEKLEITQEMLDSLQELNPDLIVDEVECEEKEEKKEIVEKDQKKKDRRAKKAEKEDDEDEEEEKEVEEKKTVKKKKVEEKEADEDGDGDDDDKEKESEDKDETFYEVEWNGETGKMDKVAFGWFKKWKDYEKRDDKKSKVKDESEVSNYIHFAELNEKASAVLGREYRMSAYVKDGAFDEIALKRDVIKKAFPELRVDKMSDKTVDEMFEESVISLKKDEMEWKKDMEAISKTVDGKEEVVVNPLEESLHKFFNKEKK